MITIRIGVIVRFQRIYWLMANDPWDIVESTAVTMQGLDA